MTDLSAISLKFKHLKCFGNEPQGFETVKPINIVIGRNSSGKSSLLDMFETLCKDENTFDPHPKLWRSKDVCPSAVISLPLDELMLRSGFPDIPTNHSFYRHQKYSDFASELLDGRRVDVEFSMENGSSTAKRGTFKCIKIENEDELKVRTGADAQMQYISRIEQSVRNPFTEMKFLRISPERAIKPEVPSRGSEAIVRSNGEKATACIHNFLHLEEFPRELVKVELLSALNSIVYPDTYFEEIITSNIRNPTNEWEIFLVEKNKGVIRLSNSGHGIQTIIFVLVNTMLLTFPSDNLERFIFGFEELENNLHPALFRRLLAYLKTLAKEKGGTFFLTTHSHVAIDMFQKDEMAQIVHVTHDGEKSSCSRLITYVQHGEILDDLDVRASDILQSNCVIWVEGPTDRIYLKRWIEVATNGAIEEGLHYQCVIYGGRLLSHLSGSEPKSQSEEAVKIFGLNRHACVLIDSDKRTSKGRINETKRRIRKEVTDMGGIAWITFGKEIENYLTPEVVKSAWKLPKLPRFGEFDDVFEAMDKVRAGEGKKARGDKMKLAERAATLITKENWKTLDLETQISRLIAYIRKCNQIREEDAAQ